MSYQVSCPPAPSRVSWYASSPVRETVKTPRHTPESKFASLATLTPGSDTVARSSSKGMAVRLLSRTVSSHPGTVSTLP